MTTCELSLVIVVVPAYRPLPEGPRPAASGQAGLGHAASWPRDRRDDGRRPAEAPKTLP